MPPFPTEIPNPGILKLPKLMPDGVLPEDNGFSRPTSSSTFPILESTTALSKSPNGFPMLSSLSASFSPCCSAVNSSSSISLYSSFITSVISSAVISEKSNFCNIEIKLPGMISFKETTWGLGTHVFPPAIIPPPPLPGCGAVTNISSIRTPPKRL